MSLSVIHTPVLTRAKPGGRARLCTGLLTLCLSASAAAQGPQAAGDDWVYALAPGDNPWSVSQRFLIDMRLWPRLVAYNRIHDATGLAPGHLLRIPRAWLKLHDVSVTVVAMGGDVLATPPVGDPAKPSMGDALRPGTVLRTRAQSSALLRLDDGSTVLLRPDSELVITQTQRAPATAAGNTLTQTRLELRRGALDNVVAPQGKDGRYEIRTPSAVAGVRGTEFRVTSNDEGSRLEVLGGAVAVGNERGQQRLPAGTGTRTRRGEAPEAPTPLPAPPSLASIPGTLERLPIVAQVPPVPGSAGLRTQLFADDGPGTLASDLTGPPGQVLAIDVDDGRYRLQVRSIDERGLEGPAAQRLVQVHARPVPPFVLQPLADAVLTQERPAFTWTRVDAPGRRVQIQIASTAGFDPAWADNTVPDEGSWSPTEALPIAAWHWRLRAIDPQRGAGPWSDVHRLQRVLAAPALPPPQADGRRTVLRWPAVPGATGYQAQMSTDAAFASATVEATPSSAEWAFDTPAGGRYFIRVRAQIGAGAAAQFGPWSAPQQLDVADAPNHWRALWLLLPLLLAL